MLTRDQSDKEADRRWASGRTAAYWRGKADQMRKAAARMTNGNEIEAMLQVAHDYDFLAEFEQRPQRLHL